MDIRVLLLAVSSFMTTGSAHASDSSFRCGQDLVTVGDTKVDVLEKCGEPKLRELISGADERRVEEWIYQHSPRQLARILTFEGTRLVRIETPVR